jgi:hypothetical protein
MLLKKIFSVIKERALVIGTGLQCVRGVEYGKESEK